MAWRERYIDLERDKERVSFLMFKLVLEKAEEPEIKLPTSAGSSKKQESSRKNIDFCFIDYAKASDCVDHNELWKILQEMGIPDHLTCLLRNLYAGQEATELDMVCSQLALYRFQCHSPKSSHPLPLPKSPKDCSIHLCLFCCLPYRVIITIFLNSIYLC